MSWVLDHSQAELGSRLVLLAIANHADAHGRNAWPSQAKLAEEANVSVRSVKRAVATLVELGELSVGQHQGAVMGRGRTNYYELPAFIATLPSANLAPGEDGNKGTPEVEQGDICADKGPTVAPQEPSFEPSEPSSSSTSFAYGLTNEEEEIFGMVVRHKLTARKSSPGLKPIVAELAWSARCLGQLLDDGTTIDALRSARAAHPTASPDELARFLFDGTEPPKPLSEFMHECGWRGTGIDAYQDHLEACPFADPEFTPADQIGAA